MRLFVEHARRASGFNTKHLQIMVCLRGKDVSVQFCINQMVVLAAELFIKVS